MNCFDDACWLVLKFIIVNVHVLVSVKEGMNDMHDESSGSCCLKFYASLLFWKVPKL